jgi:hypothetical protein
MTPFQRTLVQDLLSKVWKGIRFALPEEDKWELRFDEFAIEYAVYKGDGVRMEVMWDGTLYVINPRQVICFKPNGEADFVRA